MAMFKTHQGQVVYRSGTGDRFSWLNYAQPSLGLAEYWELFIEIFYLFHHSFNLSDCHAGKYR